MNHSDDDTNRNAAGTASPAKVTKAGCGIRFEEDELGEGINFDGVEDLQPQDDAPDNGDRG